MENAGLDLEKQAFTADEAKSIVQKLARNLMRVEDEIDFEHRDLHCGNILVKRVNGQLEPTIIDFTLSRCKLDQKVFFYKNVTLLYLLYNKVVFADLDYDPEIFESVGDPQYDVYRQMKKATNSEWDGHYPRTNALWLAFVCGWLGRALREKNSKIKKTLKSLMTTLKTR